MYRISAVTPSCRVQSWAKKSSTVSGRTSSPAGDAAAEGAGTSRMQMATEARPGCVCGEAICRGAASRETGVCAVVERALDVSSSQTGDQRGRETETHASAGAASGRCGGQRSWCSSRPPAMLELLGEGRGRRGQGGEGSAGRQSTGVVRRASLVGPRTCGQLAVSHGGAHRGVGGLGQGADRVGEGRAEDVGGRRCRGVLSCRSARRLALLSARASSRVAAPALARGPHPRDERRPERTRRQLARRGGLTACSEVARC